ncbi:MAG: FkbM family methyltransferase [Dysgonamonadaceae bacterium]|jgi:FkbM family methyltransferase|nr:FkbM family methyltransferase [Dysgonamonadaceae bacterium]
MKLYQNTLTGYRYKRWTLKETINYFLKGVARELKLHFFHNYFVKKEAELFKHRWLKRNGKNSLFDFNGVKLPDISGNKEKLRTLKLVFEDSFLFHCFYNDRYDKRTVEYLDRLMMEGPYGYTDGAFDVTIKQNDIVIDVGAWIGDFSAYAVAKGAVCYAFEPTAETFGLLCETAKLNNPDDVEKGQIYPVRKGLGSAECEMNISISENNSGANKVTAESSDGTEKISITTLDRFVEENNLKRVDFIKADIEGFEREMLRGATNVLKKFAPKLAICTYHLPDDPVVLENIIKEANNSYIIIRLRNKLLAAVIKG